MKSILQQYGKDRGWFITCPTCDTKFMSNKKGHFRCNCKEYKNCPFCNDEPEFTTRQFKILCQVYSPIYIADEYKNDVRWTVWSFAGIKGEYHKKE